MTYEQAQNVIVDCGTCKGWTLAQVADRRAASLRWYVKGYQGREQYSSRGGRHYMGQLAGETGGITGKEAVLHDLIFRYVSVWHCRCSRTAGAYRPPPSAVEPVPELPLCGDQRGRLNVNTDKNVWRCNRCGAAGGMLALYARYNCTSNADAYREICEALGRYTPRPRVNDCIGGKAGAECPRHPTGDTPDLLAAALHAAADTHAQGTSAVTAARADRGTDRKVRVQIDPACVSVPKLCRAPAAAGVALCRACRASIKMMPGGGRSTSAAARRAFCSRLLVWMVLFAVCRYGWTRRCAAGMTHRVKAVPSISGCRP